MLQGETEESDSGMRWRESDSQTCSNRKQRLISLLGASCATVMSVLTLWMIILISMPSSPWPSGGRPDLDLDLSGVLDSTGIYE